MIPILCLVQEGRITPSVSDELKANLSQLAKSALKADAAINWIEVKEGSGFTEAKPSTSSLVSIQSNRVLETEERVSMMMAICDFWMDKTGCSINEIVAAVSDPAA